jgi:alpha-amylase
MSEAAHKYAPVAPYHATLPVSGMTRKHDLSPWQGNELQKEALRKITALGDLVKAANSDILTDIWERLQCSDYFYFMSTDNLDYKHNPFKTPYDAFISYMNIIDDLTRRLNKKAEKNNADNMTKQQIKDTISFYEKEIVSLQRKLNGKGE